MKNLKNLGKTLNKQEQIQINGGLGPISIEPFVCNSPLLLINHNEGGVCPPTHSHHPDPNLCICCLNPTSGGTGGRTGGSDELF